MKKNIKIEDVEKAFLESIVPDYPDVEATEKAKEEFEEMMLETYVKSLSRKAKRKMLNPNYKFSNQVKKKLNKDDIHS
jgi:predicted GIY-YIG superfamily endonuclease